MTKLPLQGKSVLVTGAARGFGTGIARGMAQAGANLCILDIEGDELALAQQEVERELAPDSALISRVADVTRLEDLQRAVEETVARWGRLDVVINNAGILPLITFEETTPDLWAQILGVNLTGVYNGVKAAWAQMKAQGGGHCIAIASGASVRGSPKEVAYCASKHGLEGFTKALAQEAEPYKIAVNTIGPGKRIKPTSVTRAAAPTLPAAEQQIWHDPIILAPAFVWLSLQPPARFTGLRFDAGPLVDTIAAEGYDFDFAPHKVTAYVEEFAQRLAARQGWSQLR
jgi:NAD(P)-dependent dehydrogenase (short-subunit alcohol dehydrogenase family)